MPCDVVPNARHSELLSTPEGPLFRPLMAPAHHYLHPPQAVWMRPLLEAKMPKELCAFVLRPSRRLAEISRGALPRGGAAALGIVGL